MNSPDLIEGVSSALTTALPTILGNSIKSVAYDSIKDANRVIPIKGALTTVHNAITSTATSAEISMAGCNAVAVHVVITGTGTWKIDLQGATATGLTFVNAYDNNGVQQTTGNITASRAVLMICGFDVIKIVATEISDGATCTVKVQPINL